MDLKAYFEQAKGHGVLATADASGRVNAGNFCPAPRHGGQFRGVHHAPPPDP